MNEVATILQIIKEAKLDSKDVNVLCSASNKRIPELTKMGVHIGELATDKSAPTNRPFTFCTRASFSAHTIRAMLRFSMDERVTRNTYTKTYLFTKYPILVLDVTGGIKGITKDDFSFLRTSAALKWNTPSHALGPSVRISIATLAVVEA